jgi:hypothetical protein
MDRTSNVIQLSTFRSRSELPSCGKKSGEVIQVCEEIIGLAKRGRVTGLMFALYDKEEQEPKPGATGDFLEDPIFGIAAAGLLVESFAGCAAEMYGDKRP